MKKMLMACIFLFLFTGCSGSDIGKTKDVKGIKMSINSIVDTGEELKIEIEAEKSSFVLADFLEVTDNDGNKLDFIRFEEVDNSYIDAETIAMMFDEDDTGTIVAYYEIKNSNSKKYTVNYDGVKWSN